MFGTFLGALSIDWCPEKADAATLLIAMFHQNSISYFSDTSKMHSIT